MEHAEAITRGCSLVAYAGLVPEEVVHVAAVLPSDLRQFWASSSQVERGRHKDANVESLAGLLGGALAEDGEM